MAQYIDKNALVAEIERLKSEYIKHTRNKFCTEWSCGVLDNILSFLDTIEVKEVKKESMRDDLKEAIDQSFIYHESCGDDFRSDKQIETAYKYGFETGAKWANEHSFGMKEVDLEKEIECEYNPMDGLSFEEFARIAKHFFKLGLKNAKGE